MAHQVGEKGQGAQQDALRWLQCRLTWERRLTDLRRRVPSIAGDELADRREGVETSAPSCPTRLPVAS